MILVTVGSTNHNDLIKAIDELIAEKKITEKVVCQIGKGNYIPKNCDFFRFDLEIDKNYYQKCKTIICVDSAGTIFRNLELGNKIIAVRHPTTKGSLDLGRKLSKDKYIYFIEKYTKLNELKTNILIYFKIKNPLKIYGYNKIDIIRIMHIIDGD
jgi:beta-1,4-N-acetylglucosaminyltransferase